MTHPTVIYPYIPAIPQYRYTVCRGVPKSTTVPIPVVTGSPEVSDPIA